MNLVSQKAGEPSCSPFLLSISGETKKIITFNYEICNDLDNGLVAISVDEKIIPSSLLYILEKALGVANSK